MIEDRKISRRLDSSATAIATAIAMVLIMVEANKCNFRSNIAFYTRIVASYLLLLLLLCWSSLFVSISLIYIYIYPALSFTRRTWSLTIIYVYFREKY